MLDKSMKCVFVCDNVFLTHNGHVYSNTFSYDLLKHYVDFFSKVTVIARSCDAKDVKGLPLASGMGLEFVLLENISTFTSFFGLRQRHRKTLQTLLTGHDAVIVRIPGELGLMAAEVAKENHVKCLVEVVGCAWDAMWNYGGWKSKIYAPFFFMKMKHTVKSAPYVHYVTEHFLQARYPALAKAITIGVSDVALPELNEKILLQRINRIEQNKEKIIFGTIASLNVQYKGIDIALKALSLLAHTYDHFEYHILGEGDPGKYKALAVQLGMAEKVFFDGTLVGQSAVFNWLDGIDIYLQPSLADGLPRALVEAMSRGCPAIGSSVGGIPELLDAEMIFSPEEPQKLKEIISTLITSSSFMYDRAKRNFETAEKYQKSLLDKKRKKFWTDFRDGIQ